MTLDEFLNKYTVHTVDEDGVYPNQCMDLMHAYCIEVLGLDVSVLAAPTALQSFTNFTATDKFDRVLNTPSGVPPKGALVYFGTAIGPAGHVCIALGGNTDGFDSFDSNWPVGHLPQVITHSYVGCLGWLIPKNTVQAQVAVPSDKFEELVSKSTAYDAFVSAGYQSADDVKKAIDARDADFQALQGHYNESQAQLDKANTDLATANNTLAGAQKEVEQLKTQLAQAGPSPKHWELKLGKFTFWFLT